MISDVLDSRKLKVGAVRMGQWIAAMNRADETLGSHGEFLGEWPMMRSVQGEGRVFTRWQSWE